MNAIIIRTFVMVFLISSMAEEIPAMKKEHIRIVHQDISKWDKNGDGKLTGRERDEFLNDKQKERADAAGAAEAARAKPPKGQGPGRPKPTLSPDDAAKPTPKGMPKNIEGATH